MVRSRYVIDVLSAVVLGLLAGPLCAQEYPNKIIRIITATAGGGSDFISRVVAQGMSRTIGQTVIVDNRGSGVFPGEFLSKSAPDGYTVLINGGNTWSVQLFQKSLYDPVRDMTPVSWLSRNVNIIVVHPSVPVKSVKELIALARARPGELNCSFAAVGGAGHLAAELFKATAGVNIVNISFKSTQMSVTGVATGEAQMTVADAALAKPYMQGGKIRALAVTSLEPTALAPGLPIVSESGLPGYESVGATAALAPAKTPAAIITRLNQEMVRAIRAPELKEKLLAAGEEAVGNTPEQLATKISADISKIGKLVKDLGLSAN